MCADVADAAAVDAAFGEIETAFGPVDRARQQRRDHARRARRAHDATSTGSDVLDTNLTGAFHTIRRATPAMMKARYGRIVNVSSASAHDRPGGSGELRRREGRPVGLTRSVARELARRNITCNVVAPGPIVTAMTDDLTDEWRTQVETAVPLGRFGTAGEVRGGRRIPVLGTRRVRDGSSRARRRRSGHGPLTRPTSEPQQTHCRRNPWNAPKRSSTIKEVAVEVLSVEPDLVTESRALQGGSRRRQPRPRRARDGARGALRHRGPGGRPRRRHHVGQAVDLVLAKVDA